MLLREEQKTDDTWDLEVLYPSLTNWDETYTAASNGADALHLTELQSFKGKVISSPETLSRAFELYFTAAAQLEKLYVYAHLRHDEDTTHNQHKECYGKSLSLLHHFQEQTAWMEPELLQASDEEFEELLNAPALASMRFYLEKLARKKAHTLSPNEEKLLAQTGQVRSTASKAFRALNDADFSFGSVEDSDGKEHELTHGSYGLLLRSPDRTLRRNAFCQLHNHFSAHQNTLCELLHGSVQNDFFIARARRYDSCLEAALDTNHIDTSVYHSLISAVRDGIGALHDYCDLKKEVLGVKELHLYDMYAPLFPDLDAHRPYDEAQAAVVDSASALGTEYQEQLRSGIYQDRWVDRYENKNKRSGAYSSGCYGTPPYILMNYKGRLRDILTLAHEAGHSMHSFLSRKTQPYHYSDYSIFVAEVASTFNEKLLRDYLLERISSPEERAYLISEGLEDLRATLFRQTMFAEFELFIHECVEQRQPLTPALLKDKFYDLNQFYFGAGTAVDEEISIEWARIPHFYSRFYVYQYATGVSAALALEERVSQGGDAERNDYLNFLKAGSSMYPLDALKMAGVDMRQPTAVEKAVRYFQNSVTELRSLLKK